MGLTSGLQFSTGSCSNTVVAGTSCVSTYGINKTMKIIKIQIEITHFVLLS